MIEKLPFSSPSMALSPIGARLYQAAFENNTDCMALFDIGQDGRLRFIDVNSAMESLLGQPGCELLGHYLDERLPETIASRIGAGSLACIATGRPFNEEYECELPIGRRHVLQSLIPLHDGGASIANFLHIMRDVTRDRLHEQQLRGDHQVFRTLAEHTPDTIARYDRNLLRTYANPAMMRTIGLSAEDVLGKRPSHTCAAPGILAYEATLSAVLRSGRADEHELVWPGVDGLQFISHIHIVPEWASDGEVIGVLAVGRDISALKTTEQRLHAMAFYDSLTALPNRELFKDRLEQAITQARRYTRQVAVAILDLDHFKVINDTLGHGAGDELLRETARRLQYAVRDSDTVARLGGDEFALILPLSTTACPATLAGKLLQAIGGTYPIHGRELFISASVGIACYPDDADTISELLQYADSALCHAKQQGRNSIQVYLPRLIETTTEHMALAAGLREARHNGELAVHYQPQIDLSSGCLIGAEALLRWNHPQHGQIAPDRFIPIAEETGLIVAIGEWVLREACQVAVAWNRGDHGSRDPALKVAVNLSPRQFRANDPAKAIRAILQETGCEPKWLTLEITEGLLLDNDVAVRESLERLFDMGLTLAIDDFGTGYSSLGYLSRFPVGILKIDRSFIHGIDHRRESVELVKAIISMAHALNMVLVAEGVEELSQQAFLQSSGCHGAQGFLYGKAMPREDFEQLQLYRAGLR